MRKLNNEAAGHKPRASGIRSSRRAADTVGTQLTIAEKGFYFSMCADDRFLHYHELVYFPTLEEMRKYLKNEFEATDGAFISTCPVETLLRGTVYQLDHRMGCNTSEMHCRMYHERLDPLYWLLDSARPSDNYGMPIRLSSHLRSAKDESDIQQVIDAYNAFWSGLW